MNNGNAAVVYETLKLVAIQKVELPEFWIPSEYATFGWKCVEKQESLGDVASV